MYQQIKKDILEALRKSLIDLNYLLVKDFVLEKSKSVKFGSITTNLPFIVASRYGKNAAEVAKAIVGSLSKIKNVTKVEYVDTGYINFYLSNKVFDSLFEEIIRDKENFGRLAPTGQQFIVEIVSANPNGLLHIGHVRNAIYSDTICNLLTFLGNNVLRVYLINDQGTQVKEIVNSVWAKYKFLLFGTNFEELTQIKYNTQDAEDCAKALVKARESEFAYAVDLNNQELYEQLRSFVVSYFIKQIDLELQSINIPVDIWHSEKDIVTEDALEATLAKIESDIYTKDSALWFKTTKYFPNLKDDVIIKSNGEHTYFGQDIVYHLHKLSHLNADGKIVNVFAVDHAGHVPRLSAFFKSLGQNDERLVFKSIQLAKIINNNKAEVISKRNNNLLTLQDLLKIMSYEEIRWFFISKDAESSLDIDVGKLKNKNYNNPIVYVLYAYARLNKLLNKVPNRDVYDRKQQFDSLTTIEELEIINTLYTYKDQLEQAALQYKPYLLCAYLFKLAQEFHSFYEQCQILSLEENQLKNERLSLCYAVKCIFESCLSVLKIEPKLNI